MSKLITEIPEVTDFMPRPLLEAVHEQSEICQNSTDLKYLLEWWENPTKWRFPQVSVDTFLDNKKYLGVGDIIYPEVRSMTKDIIDGNYSQGVIVAGIGSGKTATAELLECYYAHKLLCLRDPYKTYALAKDKPITLINMGITATQALDNCFEGIKKFMEASPWFMGFNPRILGGTIRFTETNILLLSGNSKATTSLGYNIFYAVLDEAAFYLDNENKNTAQDIYEALQRRIVSRFGHEGLVMMISSPRHEQDFIMKKLDEAIKHPDLIYSKQLPTWKCKPMYKADMANKFYFNSRQGLIEEIDEAKTKYDIARVKDKIFRTMAEYWEIPGEYYQSFKSDPDKAKRDFAAIPSKSIQAFMPHAEIIEAVFTDEVSPARKDGSYVFPYRPLRVSYYIHIDLALNKNGKTDKAGFAMAHFDGWIENTVTGEKQKKVVVDLAEQIKAGPTGEVRFEDVRQKVYALKKMGYNIRLVTLDQYQSVDTIQTFRSKGIRAEVQSVDREIEPYNTFKELIYDGRVRIHKMPELVEELRRLEISKAMKVDHPPKGSKDVADAVCGAIFSVINSSDSDVQMLTGNLEAIKNPDTPKTNEERAEHYTMLKEMIDQGFIQ